MKTIGTRLYEMLHGDIMTDITFMVQGTRVKCHRNVVSSHGGPLKDLSETKAAKVQVPREISSLTFRTVLQYMYTDECAVDNNNVFELLYAAKIFHLDDLANLCITELKGLLTRENIGSHTAQALHFEVEEYLRICNEYLRKHSANILYTKEFLSFSQEVLLDFVSSAGIECSDLELFGLCLEWAENNCKHNELKLTVSNIRNILGDVLNEIRFSQIPEEDFLGIVVPMEILTNDEVGQVISDWQKAKGKTEKTEKAAKLSTRCDKLVKVSVETFTTGLLVCMIDTETVLSLPLSTRISQLKEMKIFEKGTRRCPPGTFSLEHRGKEVTDDVTLSSLHSPGEDLVLKLCSFTFTIAEATGAWKFPLTLEIDDYWSRVEEIILEHLYALKDIGPSEVKWIDYYYSYPGDTVDVNLK